MAQKVTIYRYTRTHPTYAETSVTHLLNQRMGAPCNGGAAIVLPAAAPPPSSTLPKTCDTCLALVEMDLVDTTTVTVAT